MVGFVDSLKAVPPGGKGRQLVDASFGGEWGGGILSLAFSRRAKGLMFWVAPYAKKLGGDKNGEKGTGAQKLISPGSLKGRGGSCQRTSEDHSHSHGWTEMEKSRHP